MAALSLLYSALHGGRGATENAGAENDGDENDEQK